MSATEPMPGSRVRRVALPAIVTVVAVIGSFGASNNQEGRRTGDWFMVVLVLLGSVALYWLRSQPVLVLWATIVSTLVYMLMQYGYGPVIFSFVIAVFTVIRTGHRLAGWSGIVALYAGHVLGRVVLGINEQGVYQVLLVGACFVVLGFIAELFRGHRERVMAASKTRREAELRQAGKEALVELRSIVGVLRQSDESAPRQPVAGLDRLDHLISRTSMAGLEVHAIVHGDPRPTSLDRAAFPHRRHARASHRPRRHPDRQPYSDWRSQDRRQPADLTCRGVRAGGRGRG
ncbi:hypothetical protein [Streptomyces sp. SID13031]|uniref:hypothetical protein n=1 Tax=Streptomyces sp. SID13031 TaxID=2706046 RepID=UPI0019416073|nr:hypothetical protein [Streptomyces sp. SID13031]